MTIYGFYRFMLKCLLAAAVAASIVCVTIIVVCEIMLHHRSTAIARGKEFRTVLTKL